MALVMSSMAPSSRPRTAARSRASLARTVDFFAFGCRATRSAGLTPTASARRSKRAWVGANLPRSIREIVASATSASSATWAWVSPACWRSRRMLFGMGLLVLGVAIARRHAQGHGGGTTPRVDHVLDLICCERISAGFVEAGASPRSTNSEREETR